MARSTADSPRGVGTLISLLLHFPEMLRVGYDSRYQVLRISLYSDGATRQSFQAIRGQLKEALKAFFRLERRRPERWHLTYRSLGRPSVLEITRDVASLTWEEIILIFEVLRLGMGDQLLTEPDEASLGDGFEAPEPVIEEMLNHLRRDEEVRNLLAWREAGRLLVFHK